MADFFCNRLWRTTCTFFCFYLFCSFTNAIATTSRVNSLGGNGDYFEDDSNAMRWFGSLTDFPDQVVLESGNFNIPDGYWRDSYHKASGPGFGVHFALGQESRWGTAALFYHDHGDDRSFSLSSSELRNNLAFLYAFDFGPLTAAAFYRHGSRTEEIAEKDLDFSANNVGIGTRINLSGSAYLDLAWESQFSNHQESAITDAEGSDSESNFTFRGRGFIALGQVPKGTHKDTANGAELVFIKTRVEELIEVFDGG